MKSCRLCGKKALIGIDSTHKHGGGWAMRGPATRKVWQPNLQKQKVIIDGRTQKVWLCTKCLRKVKSEMKKLVQPIEPISKPSSTGETSTEFPKIP